MEYLLNEGSDLYKIVIDQQFIFMKIRALMSLCIHECMDLPEFLLLPYLINLNPKIHIYIAAFVKEIFQYLQFRGLGFCHSES